MFGLRTRAALKEELAKLREIIRRKNVSIRDRDIIINSLCSYSSVTYDLEFGPHGILKVVVYGQEMDPDDGATTHIDPSTLTPRG